MIGEILIFDKEHIDESARTSKHIESFISVATDLRSIALTADFSAEEVTDVFGRGNYSDPVFQSLNKKTITAFYSKLFVWIWHHTMRKYKIDDSAVSLHNDQIDQ